MKQKQTNKQRKKMRLENKYTSATLSIIQVMVNQAESCAAFGSWDVKIKPSDILKVTEFLIDNDIAFDYLRQQKIIIYFGGKGKVK